MRLLKLAWLPLAVLFVSAASSHGFRQGETQRKPPPPLSLEGYLDEKLPESEAVSREDLPANNPCYVCHGNLQGEELVSIHAAAEIGCITCHGESSDHRNDEDNATPPEVMYGRQAIVPFCEGCHADHNVAALVVLKRSQEKGLIEKAADSIVCTDCHFDHRLRIRTVRWEKSGK